MICGHYGRNIDMIALRRQINLSARGASLASVQQTGIELGMESRALSLDLHELNALRMPCILHWNFNHFVVLVSVRKNRFVLHDPARGRRTVGSDEMSQCFTGVALEVWPGSTFVQETMKSRIGIRALISSVQGIRGVLSKIFCLSLIIEAIGDACRYAIGDGSCYSCE